ncbi:lipase family alpha/beta hydrolase [Noviherbaspirillum sedimenti]|uniref:GPI inositol-deacylase PGAP1-like alpha/beta domain-containing protein n=1 Tax=Noviherbaspirillum sedimenti TaxID=2320865 RepID=A0A3A3FXW6_9BURK|nr:hypothetical protein [Noviherbaspirillum sedimenti]RJG00205.1 hypothetical protein D3878_00340 [Noviherbaspirillum sedimenti]
MSDHIPYKDERSDPLRLVEVKDEGTGSDVVRWSLTNRNLNDPVVITVRPTTVLPIIFVPGIMGSNLALINAVGKKSAGAPVWVFNSGGGMAWDWTSLNPAERQRLLDPANTRVYAGGDVPDSMDAIGDASAIRNNRFWGEVGAGSYEEFLVWLSDALNTKRGILFTQKPLIDKNFTKDWGPVSGGFIKTEKDDVDHATKISFPVYACGYNWLQSNFESAKILQKRIAHVIKVNNGPSRKCEKVILVTHSMGGLVARACSELLGMQDKIAGIVHGVMPATGAGVAYKRVRAGSEGTAQLVLGRNAEAVSAVFANAPGALQLLPSHTYPSEWLQLGVNTGKNFKKLHAVPAADKNPYDEIYLKRGEWWSLMREELINPAGVSTHRGWADYAGNVETARKFHNKLAPPELLKGKYHPVTYSLYGCGDDDSDERTWGNVRWECEGAYRIDHAYRMDNPFSNKVPTDLSKAKMLNELRVTNDDGNGGISMVQGKMMWNFELSGKDSGGDGTVPTCSGSAANAGSLKSYALTGIEHEPAYRNSHFQLATLHSILKIARRVRVLA